MTLTHRRDGRHGLDLRRSDRDQPPIVGRQRPRLNDKRVPVSLPAVRRSWGPRPVRINQSWPLAGPGGQIFRAGPALSGRQVAEPVGHRDLVVAVAAERLDEDQVLIAGVLDVVTAIAPDQADITGPEVCGVGVRADHELPAQGRDRPEAERIGVPPPPRSAFGLGGGLKVPEPGRKRAVKSRLHPGNVSFDRPASERFLRGHVNARGCLGEDPFVDSGDAAERTAPQHPGPISTRDPSATA